MEGRSVRWISAVEIRPDAARPTRPVPAPSSNLRALIVFDPSGIVVVVVERV